MTRLADLHGAINLGQGFPDFAAPRRGEGGRAPRDRRGPQPVPDHVGHPGAPRARSPGTTSAGTGCTLDPETEVCVTCGSTEAMIVSMLATARSRRRDRAVRALLRELQPRRDPDRRHAPLRRAPPAGLDVRRGRAPGRVQRAHARDRAELAEQPDRQGVRARGARGDRRALRALRRDRDHRRDLRAHHLRRRAPHADGDDPRDGGPDGHDQRALEDLRGDRLARRVGGRGAEAHARHPDRARLPHGRRGDAAAARRRRRRSRCPSPTTSAPATSTRPGARS